MAAPLAAVRQPSNTLTSAPLVLIVDDEPSIRRLLAFNLSRASYRVEAASTGEEALELLDRLHFDVVLLDLMLPGIDGLEVLRQIRRRNPSLPVILLTAHGSIENAVEAMKLGARDFLTKPFEMERLNVAIRNTLEISQLSREVESLRTQLSSRLRFDDIVGASGGLRDTVLLLEKVIPTDLTVLIQGESGTGKELIAQAIHNEGPRSSRPFVAINCAALPEALLESELFGYEKGAFTDAGKTREGKFECADGGTVFLDEIAEMSPAVQAKLLRTLQDRTVTRLGSSTPIAIDVRILCATNKDLLEMCKRGEFREDLYYRVAVFPLTIPPLRERPEDIPSLARHILALAHPDEAVRIHPEAMEVLEAYRWPGNVRELQNVLRRATVLAGNGTILPEHFPASVQAAFADTFISSESQAAGHEPPIPSSSEANAIPTLDEVERNHILRAIESCRGNLSETSRVLAIGRTTLYRKLHKYGIAP